MAYGILDLDNSISTLKSQYLKGNRANEDAMHKTSTLIWTSVTRGILHVVPQGDKANLMGRCPTQIAIFWRPRLSLTEGHTCA